MAHKYVDTSAIMQVIGNIFTNVSLLDNEDYHFYSEDFPEQFHKILFGTIYNLHVLGAQEISFTTIEDYLTNREKDLAIYKSHKGQEFLEKISENVSIATFKYYYDRMKKMTLLRMYNERCGMDLSWLYDIDNIMDLKKKQAQEEWFDNNSLETIAETIDRKIEDIKLKYVDNADETAEQAGSGALDLLSRLKENPEFGYPLYGSLINTVTRGARLKKVYLRSAATGIGKSRSMIADICNIACDEVYDFTRGQWIANGTREPAIFISTEQEKSEIQTMMLAFISDVDEEHILTGEYGEGEWERVVYATKVLERCPLYIQELPDFSLQDIENTIKRGIRDWGVKYVAFDYIHSSMKILSEISSKAGIKGLREDNILFMIGVRLKDLANEYGVFILSATQLNGDYMEAKEYNQNLLRGAKSLGDKIDVGLIMLKTSQEDIEALEPLLKKSGLPTPDTKISVYKNRRGRYKDILLWCVSNKGVCKINPVFATTYQYEFIDIPDIKINIKPKLESAF